MAGQGRGRRVLALLAVLGACAVAGPVVGVAKSYRFGINETESLPNWAFVTNVKDRTPLRGQAVEFLPRPNAFYPRGKAFVKLVAGVPGDVIERRGDVVVVAGAVIGRLKAHARDGRPLSPGPVGVIPPRQYFVYTPHQDSFDSRYGEIGLIPVEAIVGVAEPVL